MEIVTLMDIDRQPLELQKNKASARRIGDESTWGRRYLWGLSCDYFNQIGLSYDYCNPIGSANIPAEIIKTCPVLPDSIFSRENNDARETTNIAGCFKPM